jgi:hypothetical protein
MNLHVGENKSGVKGLMGKNLHDDSRTGCERARLTLLGKTSKVARKNVLYRPKIYRYVQYFTAASLADHV